MSAITPTESRRRNELVGLVWMAAGLLLALSLVSFSPIDRSFHTSAPAGAGSSVNNWVGTVGAHSADLMYQLFGGCSLLLVAAMVWFGWRLFRSRSPIQDWAKGLGAFLLFLSLPAGLALIPYPVRLYGLFPVGGLTGRLLADWLRGWLNGPGSAVFLGLTLLISLYLLTAFSVEQTTTWVQAHLGWIARPTGWWARWRQARAERLTRAAEKAAANVVPIGTSQPDEGNPYPARPATRTEPLEIPVQMPVESRPAAKPRSAQSSPAPTTPRVSHSYRLPSTTLLLPSDGPQPHAVEDLKRLATVLTAKCEEFDVYGTVTQINPGPVVTTYEFRPEAGVKYNRITNLAEDLCLALEAESILIERIPGKSTVGIEVPNPRRETIVLREILESEAFTSARSPLTLALGKEINGRIRVADLNAMPHLLIAGSTGSGKSVSINSSILSILFKATPEDVKLILVDPKRLELGLYEGIPHLVTPIITDPKVAANALRNCVKEMERRLKLLAEKGVRNIEQYNRLFDQPTSLNLFEPQDEHQRLPYIVIFIDELADLMMVDSNSVEYSITRLAQMARAVGIHLVLATQRPSVDVITGLIKANFPARVSFRVATKVDSRTILDTNGAEALLGKGDMLFSPPGSGRLVRVHGPLVTEAEISQVVDFWRAQATPSYSEEFLQPPSSEEEEDVKEEWAGEKDDLYEEALRVVVEMGKASTSILQRRLRLGYGRAARLLDIMEKDGIIGPPDGSRPREVLKHPDWIAELERSRPNV